MFRVESRGVHRERIRRTGGRLSASTALELVVHVEAWGQSDHDDDEDEETGKGARKN